MPALFRLAMLISLLLAGAAALAPAPGWAQAPPGGPRQDRRPPPPPHRQGPPPRGEWERSPPATSQERPASLPSATTPEPVASAAPVDTTAPLRQALEQARAAGTPARIGAALMALANEQVRLSRDDLALPLLEEAVALANQQGDDRLGREAAVAAAGIYAARRDVGMERAWMDQANAYRDRITTRLAPPSRPSAPTAAAARPGGAPATVPPPVIAPAPTQEPTRFWPWLLAALALLPLWAWLSSQRKADALHEQTQRLARHQRQLKSANSALQEQAEQLRMAAVQDTLTGALSRKAFAQQLEAVLAHAAHYGKPVALMVFDLDHFKGINDSQGHLAGDTALRFVAGIVRENLSSEDLFGRFGGDEFLIGCADLDRAAALALAENIRLAVCTRAGIEHPGMAQLSLSLGIAHADPANGYTLDLLFSRADAALYAAKRGGRNRCELEDTATPSPPRDAHAPRSLTPAP